MKLGSYLFFLCVIVSIQATAWGPAHFAMTKAAYDVQSTEFKSRFEAPYTDPFDGTIKPISWFLINRFCMHPDAVDGPCRNESEIPRRLRATGFVFAQRQGKFMAPIAYSDPNKDNKGPRPKTYHYFTLKTEELNRIFASKGALWYFERIVAALDQNRPVDAAEFLGAFAHAIEDRVSPYHVWDGFTAQREALESNYPELQQPASSWKGNPASASLIWALSGKNLDVDLGDYSPETLGKDYQSAAGEFTKRLFQSREHARSIYSKPYGFIDQHLKDDWQNRIAGESTRLIMSEVATDNARLVADVMHTCFEFARN